MAETVRGGRRSTYAISSEGHRFSVRLGAPLRVGREPPCEICLSSTAVSRVHAWFWLERGSLWVEDLGSRNGLMVDGVRVEGRTELRVGSRITVGDRVLEVVEVEPDRTDTQPTIAPLDPSMATRPTEDLPSAAAVFVRSARSALAEGRLEEASGAVEEILRTAERSPGGFRPHLLDEVTPVVRDLASACGNAIWIDRLLATRRSLGVPLDPVATAELADTLRALPPVPATGRRDYVSWLAARDIEPGERLILERLAEAPAA